MNIAILQMSSKIGDVLSNCEKIKKISDEYLTSQSDVLVLPEVWSVGWACSKFIESAKYFENALECLKDIAKKNSINVIGGSVIEKENGQYYNTCLIIDRNGNLISKYRKNHLFSYYGCDEGKYITPGNNPVLVTLDNIKFGITICYDIRFPEIYRAYRIAGADVLVNCAAWGASKPIPWDVMTKSRAVENQCYMVALTQCGEIENNEFNLGESAIIDYKGEELASISNKEGIVCTNINVAEMYNFR